MPKKPKKEEEGEVEEEHKPKRGSIYGDTGREDLRENDEISPEEEGFMQGYKEAGEDKDEDEDSESAYEKAFEEE